MILDLLAKRQDEWLRMAAKFGSNPKDSLQEAYIKMYDRFKDEPEKIEAMEAGQLAMYMYLTIRSVSADRFKGKIELVALEGAVESIEDPYDLEEDRQIERDLDTIHNELNKWHWYDQKLLTIHTIEGMSMREISRETGISLSSIFHTIKTCKQKLRNKL